MIGYLLQDTYLCGWLWALRGTRALLRILALDVPGLETAGTAYST
jgi:hypothetical protein